jgi:hypothetical protein
VWQGSALYFESGADNTLTNSGKIHAAIEMGPGSDILTNTGTITGLVSFTGSFDKMTNGGTIHGTVFMGTGDTLTNTGSIHGDVVLANGDTLTDTGIIEGDVTLAGADTLDMRHGEIAGTVTAGTSDKFDFSGSFGHNTILDFAATGTSHDILHFASDDFANYAAVQAHMAQVGSNVVITLDAGDTIVLQTMILAHLTTHDFTFG